MRLTFGQKNNLVNTLLTCRSIQSAEMRSLITSELPEHIREKVDPGPNAMTHVYSLVTVCAGHENGLATLLNILLKFEKNAQAIQNLRQIWDEINNLSPRAATRASASRNRREKRKRRQSGTPLLRATAGVVSVVGVVLILLFSGRTVISTFTPAGQATTPLALLPIFETPSAIPALSPTSAVTNTLPSPSADSEIAPVIPIATPTQIPLETARATALPTSTPTITLPSPTSSPTSPLPPTATPSETATPALLPPTVAPPPASPTPVPSQTGLIEKISYLETLSTAQIDQLSFQFYPDYNIVPAKYPVIRYEIRFFTRNEYDLIIPIRASLFVPQTETPQTFPVFVYGAGTTGIGNDCAPLDEYQRGRNWGEYRTHMATYAAQGYIAILPHWQGYDNLGKTHSYFVAELEAYVMLDATRAVYNFFNPPPDEDIIVRPAAAVFFGGYSEGGHGAFAGHDMAASYAPELPIRGIIGHATAPDVEALLREQPSLSPYIVYAYRDYYGDDLIDPEKVFLPHWLPSLDLDASTKCVDEVYHYYPNNPVQLYTQNFLNTLYTEDLVETYPAFKVKLDENYVGWSTDTGVPVLLLHGADDDIVTPQTTELFAGRLCARGRHVNYRLYPSVNHFITRQHSFVDTLNWMQAVIQGNPPPSDCTGDG